MSLLFICFLVAQVFRSSPGPQVIEIRGMVTGTAIRPT